MDGVGNKDVHHSRRGHFVLGDLFTNRGSRIISGVGDVKEVLLTVDTILRLTSHGKGNRGIGR